MKIIVLTQEDSFAVPNNIEKLVQLDFAEVLAIVNINSKGSLTNKKTFFIKGFGLWQSFKMGLVLASHKLSNIFNSLRDYQTSGRLRSLKAVAGKYNIPFFETDKPNSKAFLEKMQALNPDIIVSYSAPVVFKENLLKLPQHGCINLHCSLLPHYAGVMPSFWTLYHQEKEGGCTVHYMDTKIDNGKILGQSRVPIHTTDSMTDIILRTKEEGGELMTEVLRAIHEDRLIVKDNDVAKGSYFTWPKIEVLKAFRKRGGKLI